MYCSSCGATVPPNSKYCNRCGMERKSSEPPAARLHKVSPGILVSAIVFLTIFGFGAIALLMVVMNGLGFNNWLIIGFTALSFLMVLLADAAFIRLLLRSTEHDKIRETRPPGKGLTTTELGVPKANILGEPPLGVTEHTTRTLEAVALQTHSGD